VLGSSLSGGGEQHIASDEVKQHAESGKRDDGEPIGRGAFEEWIMRDGPFLKGIQMILHRNGKEGKKHPSECTASDVAGGEENAVALVAFRDKLVFRELRAGVFASRIFIDEPSHHSADVDRR